MSSCPSLSTNNRKVFAEPTGKAREGIFFMLVLVPSETTGSATAKEFSKTRPSYYSAALTDKLYEGNIKTTPKIKDLILTGRHRFIRRPDLQLQKVCSAMVAFVT